MNFDELYKEYIGSALDEADKIAEDSNAKYYNHDDLFSKLRSELDES